MVRIFMRKTAGRSNFTSTSQFYPPWFVACGCALAAWVPVAVAQTPVTLEDVLRANERSIRDAQQRKVPEADVFLQDKTTQPEKTKSKDADAETCRPVLQYELVGLPASMSAPPNDLLQRYTGPCVGALQLNDFLSELNAWFQAQGWITTRAYIEAQKILTERLQIRVVPGRIERITLNGNPSDTRIASAFPVQTQGLLNLRDLEQGLENINRIPSQQGTFKLYPGQEPGTSEIRVEVKDSPGFRVSEMIDNSGSASLGYWKSTTELAWDNPFQRNDQMAIGWLQNLDRGDLNARFQGVTFNYLLPVGYHLWTASASWIDTQFTLPGINTSYLLQTQAQKMGMGYEYLYARDQQSKQSLVAGIDVSRQKTQVQDIEIKSQTRRLTVAHVGLKGKHYNGNQVYDWSLRAEQGLKAVNAQLSLPDGTDPQYRLLKIKMGATWPMPQDRGLLRSALTLQAAPHNTPTLAQIQIGGRYDVRGFQQNSLLAPSGWHVRNEYESASWQDGAWRVNAFVGLDAGRVQRMPNRQTSQQHLVGATLGLRGEYKSAKAELAYARAMSRPTEFSNESKSHWYAQLSLSF